MYAPSMGHVASNCGTSYGTFWMGEIGRRSRKRPKDVTRRVVTRRQKLATDAFPSRASDGAQADRAPSAWPSRACLKRCRPYPGSTSSLLAWPTATGPTISGQSARAGPSRGPSSWCSWRTPWSCARRRVVEIAAGSAASASCWAASRRRLRLARASRQRPHRPLQASHDRPQGGNPVPAPLATGPILPQRPRPPRRRHAEQRAGFVRSDFDSVGFVPPVAENADLMPSRSP